MLLSYSYDEYVWNFILRLAHIAGLISLPKFYKDDWKNNLHSYYSWSVHAFTLLNVVGLIAAACIYSTRDIAELCERTLEFIFLVDFAGELLYLKLNLNLFLHIVEVLGTICDNHQNDKIVIFYKRGQQVLLLGSIVLFTGLSLAFIVLLPNLPKNDIKHETIRKIYELKNPQNQLPIPVFIPFVDTSEAPYYTLLYIVQGYWGVLVIVQGVVCINLLPLFTFTLYAHYSILNKYTKLLGTIHTNAGGERIFYTNIRTGEFVMADYKLNIHWSEPGPSHVPMLLKNELDKEEYEYDYLKQLIQYQQKLSLVRRELDSYLRTVWTVRVTMNLAGICFCMYAILVPGLLSNFVFYKTILETTGYSIAYCTLFATGEYLASYKISWKSALSKSYWYNCSNQTRKLIPIVLLANQEHDYLNVKGLIPGNNIFMVNMIKTAYSAFNFMRMKAAV